MNFELRIAVCDDNSMDLEQTVTEVKRIMLHANMRHTIFRYSSCSDLLTDIQNGEPYHIILLDVMLDGMDGMMLAAELRKAGDQTVIIFISSNREMAMRGYEVSALRYLAKPLAEEKLEEALMCAYNTVKMKKEILLPTSDGQHRIPFSDIQYVEAFDRGTRFVLTEETLETKLKFSEVENILPKASFIQCHRAYIVNISLTKRIRPYAFDMKSGIRVPISRHRYHTVNQQFVDYITN